MKLEYTRGSIWWCNLPEQKELNYGVQKGYRPVVIVSSHIGNLSSQVVTICPLTTKIKPLSVNIDVSWSNDDRKSQVLCSQLMTVSKATLQTYAGSLTAKEIQDVERGICIALGIAKDIKSNIQNHQEALSNAHKDLEKIQILLPQAKELLSQLNEIILRVDNSKVKIVESKSGKKRLKRSQEEIDSFIYEWENKHNIKKDVIEAFGFNSYQSAYSFYKNHKEK